MRSSQRLTLPDSAPAGDQPDHDGNAPMPDQDGTLTLGRYRLGRRLGAGAFGIVYEARDQRLDRSVAIKVIPRELIVSARFEHEARSAARLSHPGIVALYEAAIDDDGAYLVSELVRGRTLQRLLADGECSDRQILQIGVALCDALAHAHGEGVIHRDIKPSNILVPRRPTSNADVAKLTDFGVAHLPGSHTLTQVGDVVGTAAYMAPEQAAGQPASAAVDLYALALVLYEALSGVNPIADGLRDGHARRNVPPLRRQRRELDRQLAIAIDRALLPKPVDRGELAQLREALVSALPVASSERGVIADAVSPLELTVTRLHPQPAARDPELDAAAAFQVPPTPDRPVHAPAHRAPPALHPLPDWVPRGANALAAGLAAGWLASHLLKSAPLAPLTVGLIACGLCLLLPRVGWLAVVSALTVLAAAQHHPAGGILLFVVTGVPAVALLATSQGAALPAYAPLLGLVGLAGAWPALASFTGRSWWQRAVVAASGYVWLVLAGLLIDRDLYWQPLTARGTTGWESSFATAWHGVVVPIASARGLAGALLWALIAVALPFTRTRRWPLISLGAACAAALAAVVALPALGATPIRHAVLGAIAAALIAGVPALATLTRARRARLDSPAGVS